MDDWWLSYVRSVESSRICSVRFEAQICFKRKPLYHLYVYRVVVRVVRYRYFSSITFDYFVFLFVSSKRTCGIDVCFVLCELQVATNPTPPILELVRENLSSADYNKTIEQPPSFLDSYHSPEFCFEQTTAANYLINNDGKYIYIVTQWHAKIIFPAFLYLYNRILCQITFIVFSRAPLRNFPLLPMAINANAANLFYLRCSLNVKKCQSRAVLLYYN